METINLSLNQQEVNNLVALLDIAVKQTGLSNAEIALSFVYKLNKAVEESKNLKKEEK